MRKFALMAAVLAVALAGWVRVQLVAVAQDDVANDKAVAAPVAASVKSPAGPPTKVPREQLTYDGKRFEDYQAILAHELAPDRRAEAIEALTAFSPAGYAQEVTEIILVEMNSFDERRLQSERNRLLRDACTKGLRQVDPFVATPLITAALKEQGLGTKYLALQSLTSEHQSDELIELLVTTIQDESLWPSVRMYAMQALARHDDRFEHHWEVLRPVLLAPSSSSAMRDVAVNSMRIQPDDNDEFLDRYSREFAVPVTMNAMERGDDNLRNMDPRSSIWQLLRRDPDAILLRTLDWLGTPERVISDQMIEKVLAEPSAVIPQLMSQFENSSEARQIITLRLLRNLLLKHNSLLDREDSNLRADVVKFFGQVAGKPNEKLSEEAVYQLSVLSLSGQSRSIVELVTVELNKHVPDRGPNFFKMVDERLKEEQRAEQQAEQNRTARRRQ